MSESSIPFQGQTAVMGTPMQEPLDDGRNRQKLVLVGLAAALVIVLVAAYFLVFAGGGETEDAVESAGSPAAAPVAPAQESTAPADAVQPRISAKSFGRDPFKALIVEPVAAVVVGDTAAPAGSVGVAGSSGAPDAGAPTSTDAGASAPSASDAHSFRVVEVAPDSSTVTVKVDGKVYRNLKAGEVFATYFQVRLISGEVNSFQYGEEKFNVVGTKRLTIA